MYFWTRFALCALGTAVLIHVLWVAVLMPRSILENMPEAPASTRLVMSLGWAWGVPSVLVAAAVALARARGVASSWRLLALAIIAAVSVATTWFTISAGSLPVPDISVVQG